MTEPKLRSEKRRYPRIKKNVPIKIRHADFDLVTETENISCVGAYCRIDQYVAPLTKIRAKILLPDKKNRHCCIECEGAVVRIEKNEHNFEEPYNVAIYFSTISKANMNKINRFIKERNKERSEAPVFK